MRKFLSSRVRALRGLPPWLCLAGALGILASPEVAHAQACTAPVTGSPPAAPVSRAAFAPPPASVQAFGKRKIDDKVFT